MALTVQLAFGQFAAEWFVRSSRTQKEHCRAHREQSIDAMLVSWDDGRGKKKMTRGRNSECQARRCRFYWFAGGMKWIKIDSPDDSRASRSANRNPKMCGCRASLRTPSGPLGRVTWPSHQSKKVSLWRLGKMADLWGKTSLWRTRRPIKRRTTQMMLPRERTNQSRFPVGGKLKFF